MGIGTKLRLKLDYLNMTLQHGTLDSICNSLICFFDDVARMLPTVVLKVTMFTFVFHRHARLEYFVHNLHVLVDVRVLLPAQLAHCPRLQVDHLIVGVVIGLPSSGIATQFTLEHGGLALLSLDDHLF